MKTKKFPLTIFRFASSRRPSASPEKFRIAFTLVELLVVIAIIATLAALLIPVGAAMVRKAIIQRAVSERAQLETAIQAYYSKYGFYPPQNGTPGNWLTNQLYYELIGTTASAAASGTNFTTLDDSSTISAAAVASAFNVSAFMNCTKGSGEDAVPAQTFLPRLTPNEIATETNSSGASWNMIVTAANSDPIYKPLPGVYSQAGRPANPWRYMYPGTNNPDSYDLWVQVYVGGKTNLICNWAKQPQINTSYP